MILTNLTKKQKSDFLTNFFIFSGVTFLMIILFFKYKYGITFPNDELFIVGVFSSAVGLLTSWFDVSK